MNQAIFGKQKPEFPKHFLLEDPMFFMTFVAFVAADAAANTLFAAFDSGAIYSEDKVREGLQR